MCFCHPIRLKYTADEVMPVLASANDAPATAQRLCDAAAPGEVLVGIMACRAADLEAQHPRAIAGKGIVQEVHSHYSDLGLAQSRMWPKGTLCIMIAANIAESAALGFHSCFPDSVMGFVLANAMGNVEYFLLFAETAKADLLAFALATATAQKTISLEILSSLLIPVPPLNELTRTVTPVAQLRRLCADLRQRLAASQSTQAHLAEALVQTVA